VDGDQKGIVFSKKIQNYSFHALKPQFGSLISILYICYTALPQAQPMKYIVSPRWRWMLFAYLLLLLRLGYQFGGGDQGELLPFVLYLKDPTLYSGDLYVQSLLKVWPNERWAIISLLGLAPADWLYGWCLLLHIGFTVLLLTGLRRVAALYIPSEAMQWWAVIANLTVFYYFAPGGNELYANTIIGSLASKSIGAWALYYFLRGRLAWAVGLALPATWFHPLAGLHLALVFFAAHGLLHFRDRSAWPAYLGALLVYAALGLSYVAVLRMKVDGGLGPTMSDAELYRLWVDFRNPHHYDPTAFPLRTYLVTGLLLAVGFYVFRSCSRMVVFMAVGVALFLIGVVNGLFFENLNLAFLQFFKMSIWLKFVGIVGVFAYLARQPHGLLKRAGAWQPSVKAIALVVLAIIVVPTWKFKPPIDLPFNLMADAEVSICLKARERSPREAVFAHPIRLTKFGYYAQRSSYVTFVSTVREKAFAEEWAQRLQTLYGISPSLNQERSKALRQIANKNYCAMGCEAAAQLRAEGVTHLITFQDCPMDCLTEIWANEGYRIYAL
jgi:hypothetical protein